MVEKERVESPFTYCISDCLSPAVANNPQLLLDRLRKCFDLNRRVTVDFDVESNRYYIIQLWESEEAYRKFKEQH